MRTDIDAARDAARPLTGGEQREQREQGAGRAPRLGVGGARAALPAQPAPTYAEQAEQVEWDPMETGDPFQCAWWGGEGRCQRRGYTLDSEGRWWCDDEGHGA